MIYYALTPKKCLGTSFLLIAYNSQLNLPLPAFHLLYNYIAYSCMFISSLRLFLMEKAAARRVRESKF